jgi:hypothetical protein
MPINKEDIALSSKFVKYLLGIPSSVQNEMSNQPS